MGKISAKNKIFISIAVWLAMCTAMFMYGFKIWASQNQVAKGRLSELYRELHLLEAEKESFELAQKDLEELSLKLLQPENFFSKDVTLVNELETIEKLGEQLGVEVDLAGISGTVKNAAKAKTSSDIVTIPYSMRIEGTFQQALGFLEHVENLPFITTLTALSIRESGEGMITLNTNALFYLKR